MEKYSKEYELPDSEEYYKLCKTFSLTPREMKGLCSSFYYLNKYSLEGYPDKARLLYFYILLLKYKYPDDVQILNDQNDDASEARKRLFGNKRKQPKFLSAKENFKPFFNAVIENKTLAETIFYYVNPDDSTEDDERHIGTSDPIQMDDTGSWSYILYAKDFEKGISESLDRPVLEFLFNKVESYSKDIPMTKKEEDITRGSIISFGKWHKETEENVEPIQWIVLDVEDDKALLISRYGIDRQQYNVEDKPITWKECSLREWLNNDFLMNAFNKDEQDAIVVSHVAAERNPEYPKVDPGEDTDDKVFLLSLREAAMYFSSDEARKCIPTPYAIANGAYVSDTYKTCWWWLRSPGDTSNSAADVVIDGSLHFGGSWVSFSDDAVRPSLRIHL